MHNLKTWLDPALARTLAEDSREREASSLSLRRIWHAVFDPCPELLSSFAPDGKELLESFLSHCGVRSLDMGWTLHLELLHWMCAERKMNGELSSALCKELLAAAVARWATSDLSSVQGVVALSPHLPRGQVVGAWKSASFLERRRIFSAYLPGESPQGISYALLAEHEFPMSPRWVSVGEGV